MGCQPKVTHITKPASITKKPHKQHALEFRHEALKLAERIDVAGAARELSLYESQLYNWRSKQQNQLSSSEREQLINVRARRNVINFTQNPGLSRLVSFKVLSIERYPGVSRCGHPDVTSPLTPCEAIQLVSDENASVCGRSGSGRVCVSPCKRAVRAAYECV